MGILSFSASLEELSALGDGFVNLIYSLAVSNALKKPVSKRVSNHILAEALAASGLRSKLGSRVTKHELADYAEALIFYAWAGNKITIEECVDILSEKIVPKNLEKSAVNAFAELLKRTSGALK